MRPSPLPPFSSVQPISFVYGYGSFFSGAMLLCLTLVFFIRNKSAWIVISGVLISIFITEAGFFFRLAPQNWWIPILILVFFLAQDEKTKNKSSLASPIPKAAKVLAIFIAACLLQSTTLTFLHYARVSALIKSEASELRKQGGWYITIDKDLFGHDRFFKYYASGLTGIGLPTLKECSENAQKQKIHYGFIVAHSGLILCRP